MSDLPPPPPPPPDPPDRSGRPLPPPDDRLAAPPGYSGYTASPMSSVPLKRVGGLGRAAIILVAITALSGIAVLLVGIAIEDDARAFLDGTMSADAFQTSLAPYGVVALVQGVVQIAAAVVVVVWMYRLAGNHRSLQRQGRWRAGWAIGGWFLPPFVYVIPFLVFRELWRASDPDVALGGDWRSRPVPWVISAWFVMFGPVSLALQVSVADTGLNLGTSETNLAELIVDNRAGTAMMTAATVIAAVLFATMAWQLTDRHRRLIGER